MRLWTLHPCLLDKQGLGALWREALLAQAVIKGQTKGYKKHPQLTRFMEMENPQRAIANYLSGIHEEGQRRGYIYDESKIGLPRDEKKIKIKCKAGQLKFERLWLEDKLKSRSPEWLKKIEGQATIAHELFEMSADEEKELWEKAWNLRE